MKRSILLAVAVLLALSVMLAGCGAKGTPADSENSDNTKASDSASEKSDSSEDSSTQSNSDDSWGKIKSKGKFIVGLDDAFPPMGFRDKKGEIVGFDIDLAREAAKRMGVEVEFQPVNWDTIIMEINSGNIDVIWNGLTITEERQEKISFTKPYIEDKQILVVGKNSPIKGKADLAGKLVGLQAGSSSKKALARDAETLESIKEVVEFSTNDEALLALKNGQVEAVIVDEVVGRYYIEKDRENYIILEDHFGLEEFGVGLRKTDGAFLKLLDETLEEIKEDGTATEISKKWFGEDIVKK